MNVAQGPLRKKRAKKLKSTGRFQNVSILLLRKNEEGRWVVYLEPSNSGKFKGILRTAQGSATAEPPKTAAQELWAETGIRRTAQDLIPLGQSPSPSGENPLHEFAAILHDGENPCEGWAEMPISQVFRSNSVNPTVLRSLAKAQQILCSKL